MPYLLIMEVYWCHTRKTQTKTLSRYNVIICFVIICHLRDLIKFYFMLRLIQGEIVLLLSMVENSVISRCTVRRTFKCMNSSLNYFTHPHPIPC